MSKRTYEEYIKNGCHPVGYNEPCQSYYFGQVSVDLLLDQIDQLKQQLEEYKNKENTSAVNSWDEMLKNCENCGLNECIGCEYTQTCVQNIKQQLAEKDTRIEELEGQFAYECECNKQLVELQKQLAEKDKEIERLKFFERIYYQNQLQASQEDINRLFQSAYQSPIAVGLNEIAIQELEKVKEKISKLPITDILDTDYGGFKKIYQTDAMRIIDRQINELKGEKDDNC